MSKMSEKWAKVANSQNFKIIAIFRIFSEEQGLRDGLGLTSVATIFKFAMINLANLKIVATLV